MRPHTGLPGIHHTVITVEREKKKVGVVGGKQQYKKSTKAEKQLLKKKHRSHNALQMWFQIATTLRPRDLREPVHICMTPLTTKQNPPTWTPMHRN